jgi:hypothetical protein
VRRRAKHLFELLQAPVELDELGAALPDELVVEAVSTVHLEDQPAEVAKPVVSYLQQRPPFAAEDAGGGKDDAR